MPQLNQIFKKCEECQGDGIASYPKNKDELEEETCRKCKGEGVEYWGVLKKSN